MNLLGVSTSPRRVPQTLSKHRELGIPRNCKTSVYHSAWTGVASPTTSNQSNTHRQSNVSDSTNGEIERFRISGTYVRDTMTETLVKPQPARKPPTAKNNNIRTFLNSNCSLPVKTVYQPRNTTSKIAVSGKIKHLSRTKT